MSDNLQRGFSSFTELRLYLADRNPQYLANLFAAFGWTSYQNFSCHYDDCYHSATLTEKEFLEDGWRKDEDGYTCPECIDDEIAWAQENGRWRYWFRVRSHVLKVIGFFIPKYRRNKGVYFDGNYVVQSVVETSLFDAVRPETTL